MKKILEHLWYLFEEVIALTFFDDGVTDDAKYLMVSALQTPATEHPLKEIIVDYALVNSKNLQDFFIKSSHKFFIITEYHQPPSTFFNKHGELWPTDKNYNLSRPQLAT